MGDWDNIAQWNHAAMASIGDDLAAQLKKVRGTEAELRDAATPKVWHGEGADAAKKSLSKIERGVLHRVEEFAALQTAVDDAAERIKHLRTAMEETEALARANDFKITDGALAPRADAHAPGPGQSSSTTDPDVRAALEAQIEQIIRTGLGIDADLTTVMLSLIDGNLWDGKASTMAAAAASGAKAGDAMTREPPKNATPEQNKAWWDTLTPTEQAWLSKHKPELIGNRKGLPYEVRHQANVNRIATERERLTDQLAKMKTEEGVYDGIEKAGSAAEFMKQMRLIEAKLDALDVLDAQDKAGNTIMTLDTAGERVRAAVGIGNIDKADYLTVHTPGMNSAVEDNMNRYVDELSETTNYAREMLAGSGKTVGTVVWMDYLPPKADLAEGPAGLSDDRAEEGAKRLSAELEGIQASRAENPPQRLTAVGHSYGSLTTALALQQSDAADAFVSQGSPGWGDDGGAGLKVPNGEMYNMRTEGDDLVAGLGWHGGNPQHYANVDQLGTQDAVAADGERLQGTEGHSGYTMANDEKSTSEYNTAAVMVGRDDLLIRPPIPREHTDTN